MLQAPIRCSSLLLSFVLVGGCFRGHEDEPLASPLPEADAGATPPASSELSDAENAMRLVESCLRQNGIFCSGFARCCDLEERRLPADECEEWLAADCHAAADEPAVRDGLVRWDADIEAQNHAILRDAAETCEAWAEGRRFPGTVGRDGDCTPGDHGLPYAVAACEVPLVCVPVRTGEGVRGRCTDPREEGSGCWYDEHCAAGLYCDFSAAEPDSAIGECAPLRATGMPCHGDTQCEGKRCEGHTEGSPVEDGVCAEGSIWCGATKL